MDKISTVISLVAIVAYVIAMFSGWRIVSFLEERGEVKKSTPLFLVSPVVFINYFKIMKEEQGRYSATGILYISSLAVLISCGIFFIILP